MRVCLCEHLQKPVSNTEASGKCHGQGHTLMKRHVCSLRVYLNKKHTNRVLQTGEGGSQLSLLLIPSLTPQKNGFASYGRKQKASNSGGHQQ